MLVLQEILNSEFTIQENLGFFLVQYTVNFYIFHIQKKKKQEDIQAGIQTLYWLTCFCV